MKKFLFFLTTVPLGAVALLAQSSTTSDKTQDSQRLSRQSWSGTLVAADCQDSGGLTAVGANSHATSKNPDLSANRSRDRNTTYEQRTNPTSETATSTTVTTDRSKTDESKKMEESKRATDPTPTTSSSTADRDRDRSTTSAQRSDKDKSKVDEITKVDESKSTTETTSATTRSSTADRARDRSTTYEQRTDESIAKTTVDPSRNPADPSSAATSTKDQKMASTNMDDSCRVTSATTSFALRLKDGRTVRFDDASNAKIVQQLQTGDRLKNKSKPFNTKVKGTMTGDVITLDSIQI